MVMTGTVRHAAGLLLVVGLASIDSFVLTPHCVLRCSSVVHRPAIETLRPKAVRAPPLILAADEEGEKQEGASKAELKKMIPLGMMFFFILFNYTILRDTKDVLVVTAYKSGAEIIPFLKTYVNLPGAIGFTVLYSKLTNKYSRNTVFYICIIPFLIFFALFAALVYPNVALFHPHAFADMLTMALPAGFAAPIAIIRNWTFAVFYTMAELWGSVVVSVLFWGALTRHAAMTEEQQPQSRPSPVQVLPTS